MPGLSLGLSPFMKPINWAAYWATRFPSAPTLTVISDIEIDLTWTNNGTEDYEGVSIERTDDGGITWSELDTATTGDTSYSDTAGAEATHYFYRVRYYTGSNYSAYTDVVDGVTIASEIYAQTGGVNDVRGWYDSQDLSTITKDADTGEVSLWEDKLAGVNNLAQAGATQYPIWDAEGVEGDGINDFLHSPAFAFVQPEVLYLVIQQVVHTANKYVFDGFAVFGGALIQTATSDDSVALYAGAANPTNLELTVGRFRILRVLINGGSSKLQSGKGFVNKGNAGANDMGGLTLFSQGAGIGQWSNVKVKEVIAKIVDPALLDVSTYHFIDDEAENNIFLYLQRKHGYDRFQNKHILNIFNSTVDELCTEPTALVSDDGEQIDIWFNLDYTMQYSYSTDGLTFAAPIATDVTADYTRAHMLKVGDTYYLYVTDYHGLTPFHLFTSTDKIHFTDQGAVLNNGGALDWDKIFGNIFVWHEDDNWFMLYEGANWDIDGYWKTGLATAAAPEGPWTKEVTNPVFEEPTQPPGTGNPEMPRVNNEVIKHGGNYYIYYHCLSAAWPGDLRRAYSTDLITWVTEGNISDYREEVVDWNNGDQCLVEFKGRSYLFYSLMNQVDEGRINVEIDIRTMAEMLALTP